MIDADSLNIWYQDRLVGYLWREGSSGIEFQYAAEWVDNSSFIVSQSLPLTEAPYSAEDGLAHRFFANFLPEGSVRERIVRDLKIANTDFELLKAIGGECAGALSILSVEREPSTSCEYRKLDDKDLEEILRRGGQIYTAFPPEQRPRLSLAGAQDKCPVLRKDDGYYLPQSEAPSSHILKFEVRDYPHLPAYEAFTTQLASAVNLPVVNIALCEHNGTRFAEIERYDRIQDDDALVRLHQEDFCQALGYGHENKYQQNRGPSFADCVNLVRDVSSEPAIDVQNLIKWQIFNVLAGNSDGHAKNLSLLYNRNGTVRLAPFYDLICTRAIERIDANLAFGIGGQRDPDHINASHWGDLAKQCDIAPRLVNDLIDESATVLNSCLNTTRDVFEENYGANPSLQRIEAIVRQQNRLIRP